MKLVHHRLAYLHSYCKESASIKLGQKTEQNDVEIYVELSRVVVKALSYKLEGRVFETRWGEFSSIYLILPAALGPGVYSASNTSE
jgi:hypothetical protein